MTTKMIGTNIVIDDVETVINTVSNISGQKVDFETIAKFIENEPNTKFYIDKKLNSRTENDPDCTYLWLDTGFTDRSGNAIWISTLRQSSRFVGHFTGRLPELKNSVADYFRQYKKDINKNYSRFVQKYNNKISARTNQHITNQNEFLVQMCNASDSNSQMGTLISALGIIEWAADEVVEETEEAAEVTAVAAEENFEKDELTISLLCDQIDAITAYVNKLEKRLKKYETEDIPALQEENRKYKEAMVAIRAFAAEEQNAQTTQDAVVDKQKNGHDLLQRNKKILILGETKLKKQEMEALAVNWFGFDRRDLEFQIDYAKTVRATGRIENADRYQAVIFGCIPHSVAGKGDWSGLISKMQNDGRGQITIDARNKSGKLEVTRESFKLAMWEVCKQLEAQGKGLCA